MRVTFLGASTPIAKVFTTTKQSQYPRIYEFTTYNETIETLEDFYQALCEHAEEGHCLLKGKALAELKAQSRAGNTDPNDPTEWLCLDLDGIPGLKKAEDFLQTIPELKDTSYIIQYSASMGINPNKGFSAHIFMLLDSPVLPNILKSWLTELNFDSDILNPHFRLNRTNNALKWPLDISVCQNDKLIYIAPPITQGRVKDKFEGKRIQLVLKSRKAVSLGGITPNAQRLRDLTNDKINELRKAKDLLPKTFRTKIAQGIEVLARPDESQVTDIKEERGFVYLNLNGGDSWGYFHPSGNPDILYNFKGEPNYLIKDLLPDYYARYREQMRSTLRSPESKTKGKKYLAFLDPREDAYYRGIYAEEQGELILHRTGQKAKVIDFLKQHGQYVDEFIPEWTYEFRFDDDRQIDFTERFVNRYQPTEYMDMEPVDEPQIPPTIRHVIEHVLGNDKESVEHFLNWLAVIYQHRQRAQTMWVLTGTQGTGKGVLFNQIITPIFGPSFCTTKSLSDLDNQFTGFLEHSVFLLIDEASINAVKNIDKVIASVKNWCVEPFVSIRRMRADHYMARNFINIIFASNQRNPILVDRNDRRFNVGPYQSQRLEITDQQINELIPAELDDFATYLASREADAALARTPLDNQARRDLMQLSVTSMQEVADAILTGDFGFLVDQLPSRSLLDSDDNFAMLWLDNYEKVLGEIFDNLDQELRLTREQLRDLFAYCVGDMPSSPNKLTSRLKHLGLRLKRMRKDEGTIQGLIVRFSASADSKKAWAKYVKQKGKKAHLHLHRRA